MTYNDRITYYENLLRDPFPLLKSDLQSVIKRDAYNAAVNGAITADQHQAIVRKFDL